MLSRDALRRKAIKSGHITDWDEYRSMRNKVTNAIKTTKAKYYQDKLLSQKGNLRSTWRTINEITSHKMKNTFISEIEENGSKITENEDISVKK